MSATEAPPQRIAGTVGDWLRNAIAALDGASPSPRADAEWILCAVLGTPRGRLLARRDRPLDAGRMRRADALLARRQTGEPVAYLLGEQEFWSLPLRVTPQVLVPRPETETVVERALAVIKAHAQPRILELGTGSGAIALALACERPDARITATDCSAAAVDVARDNARRHGLEIMFLVGDWFTPLTADDRFDLIVSNPPYVAPGDPALEPAVARYEPAVALYAADDGLAALTAIVKGAAQFLVARGGLILEHGATQGAAVKALLVAEGFTDVCDDCDLAGLPRVASGRRPAEAMRGGR